MYIKFPPTNSPTISEDLDHISAGKSYLCDPESCKSILANNHENHSFKILTQNIRSINRNIDAFKVLLSRIDLDCDVFILTETWNSTNTNIPTLTNYDSHYTTKNYNQNDGLIIYTKTGFPYLVVEPHIQDATCLTVKVNPNTLIIGIYRSPSIKNITPFLDSLDRFLINNKSYTNLIITGDINIDIKVNNYDSNSHEYLNVLASHGLMAGHCLPTRIENCLDHSMVKTKNPTATLVLKSPLTDHSAVISCLDLETHNCQISRIFTTKRVLYPELIAELRQISFNDVFASRDVNWAAEKLTNTLSNLLNKYTRITTAPRRSRCLKPWITKGLLGCMRNRDRMHLRCKSEPNNEVLNITYKRYKNFCNDLLKRLKRTYEKNELMKYSNDPKKTWDTVKSIVYTKKKKTVPNELLKIGETPEKSVELVNNFFANVGKSYADKIPNNSKSCFSSLLHKISPINSLGMTEVDNEEIETIIMGLKNDSATGWDGISNVMLKTCKSYIIPVLTHIVNLSLSSGIFPNVFKISIIHPIHKVGDKDCVNNYRPISVLPALSKILEKVMNKRLLSFLGKENLLSNNQYGFRAGMSTSDAVTGISEYIAQHLDKKRNCIGIFLDLAKAFDTVSAPILLHKMEKIGIRGLPLQLFESYITNRFQRVKIGNQVSTDCPVLFGVPQGSVLGPSLFLIYINDLCNLKAINCKVFTFADDTALVFHGACWEETRANAENGLQLTMDWLQVNKLTLNTSKTKYITFGKTTRTMPCIDFKILAHTCNSSVTPNLICQCTSLERVESIKYLGVLVDHTFTWIPHLQMTTDRLRKLFFIFKTLRHVAEPKLLKNVYYALAQSLITYCVRAWGGAKKSHLIRVERAQRALLKIMSFKPYRFPTARLFALCDVLTVRQLFIVTTIMAQHKIIDYDESQLQKRRKDKILSTVTCKSVFMHKFQYFLCPLLYNKVNKALNIYPLNNFHCKSKLIGWLKTLCYNDIENLLSVNI
jgi:hypothetical protein